MARAQHHLNRHNTIIKKTDAIEKLSSSTNLKKLLLLCDLFIIWENLSPICRNCVFHLALFLRKIKKFIWTDEHEDQLKLIKQKIAETTENKHFNPDIETRIKCDASRKGLGCALEKRTPNGWYTVAFA